MTVPPQDDSGQVTMYSRFREFITDNPRVLDLMIEHARNWVRNTGRRRLGINALIERVRWEIAVSTTDPAWKLNNSYAPYFAREIARRAPDLEGVFSTRSSMADRHYSIVRWPGADGPRLDQGEGELW